MHSFNTGYKLTLFNLNVSWIDTSGRGVNFVTLFNKLLISCSLGEYYVLYLIR